MPAYIKRRSREAFLYLLLDKAHFSFIIELVLITQISFISEIRVIYFHNLCQVC